ncbi:GntR family transcriptional regulator [Maribacter sp. PR1]|uniref:GntR family transcriptional regulator n=1 Tax=Maribacter cobaltidurans TaxID=1178778 RepID=A0ABU7IP03_9FLAO|nr:MULTISPECIES: GntR family transcriptional regulator [Maribacter]MDC6387293.1 GntR family transcriptional regulator [Maribacter sp. PR1]MEE1974678.1 GntR family transcriptional regulator [Maribacter cobaltidurans]
MLHLIQIIEDSKVPKYKQIINSLFAAIENGDIKKNDKLPSVNELLIEFDISRDTIVRAYDYLKKLEYVESVPGKGYYIKKDDLVLKAKVFLLFNKLSAHKKIIYDAFVRALGDNATVDFFIYDNNYRQFKNLIEASRARDYTHYTIICHFEEGGEDLINFIKKEIPLDKLIILDKRVELLGSKVGCIYQDFEKNIYEALAELNPQLKKYKQIKLLLRKRTYHPIEIKKGFIRFCGQYAYDFKIVEEIENEIIEKDTAYINLMENDLVILIKKIKETDLVIGKDVGIISYNDTPLKEILLDGITVISTDFEKLGKEAAKLVINKQKQQKENPFYVIQRKSL